MVFSTMPLSAMASDDPMSIKTGVNVSGYSNNYGVLFYTKSINDYAVSVLKEVDNNGVITVPKGQGFTITQTFGKYSLNKGSKLGATAGGDTVVCNQGPSWHYGDNDTDYALGSTTDHGTKSVTRWYAQYNGTNIQSGISGTLANKQTQNTNRATAKDGGSNEATGIYEFTTTSFPQLNTPGEYQITLNPTVSFEQWFFNWGNQWNSMYGATQSIPITVKVVADYEFRDINGNKVGNTIKAAGATDALKQAPANTATEYVNTKSGFHNIVEYKWSSVPDANNVFNETSSATPDFCSGGKATCQKKAVCSVCGVEYGSYGDHTYNTTVRQEPGPVINGFTYTKCDNCDKRKDGTFSYDDVSSNWTNYNNQLKVCETELSNTAKYTADSIASVRSEVDSIKTTVEGNSGGEYETLSSTFIDRQTDSLMTALTKLEIAKYKVTLRFKDENGVSLKIPGSTANYQDSEEISYGNMTLAKIPKAFEDNGYSVIKWARIGENTDTIHGLNSSSLNVVVKKNMEYAVFLKKTTVDDNQASGNAVITLNNKSNKVVDIGYVAMKQDGTETQAKVSVNTDAGTITIGNTTLTAPKYSFYNLIGFEIGGIRVASGQTITLNSKMVIRPCLLYTSPSPRD